MTISINPYDESKFAVSLLDGFTRPVLDAVRNIPGRWWNNDKKIWLIPDNKASVNRLLQNLYTTGLFNVNEKADSCEAASVHTNNEVYINSQIKRMTEALKARHYSEHTIMRYKAWTRDFLTINQNKENLGEREINEYLKNLALKKNVSASTQNQALAALLFYFRFIQSKKWKF